MQSATLVGAVTLALEFSGQQMKDADPARPAQAEGFESIWFAAMTQEFEALPCSL